MKQFDNQHKSPFAEAEISLSRKHERANYAKSIFTTYYNDSTSRCIDVMRNSNKI